MPGYKPNTPKMKTIWFVLTLFFEEPGRFIVESTPRPGSSSSKPPFEVTEHFFWPMHWRKFRNTGADVGR